jgi:CubicO group peptidase (beta-lactamase class C family)
MAVVDHGRIVFVGADGLADVARKIAATPSTRFRVGSISKIFTAVAVMQQVEKTTIDLDARVSTYLPWVPHAAEISVRQLLMHRSGLPDYLDAAIRDGRVNRPTTPREIVAGVAAQALDFRPGTAYEYSNTNYVVLGLIVEKVSGLPLGGYLSARVFGPAGLRDTTFSDPPPETPLATGYSGTGKAGYRLAPPGDPSWYYACGSIVSTATDLARFDVALMGGTLLRQETFKEMVEAARPTLEGSGQGYGLGLQTYSIGGRQLVGHHGGRPGYESDDEMLVSDRFAVVVLGNSFAFRTGPALHLGLSVYYPALVKQAEAHPAPPPPDPDPARTRAARRFIEELAQGRLDRSGVDPRLQAELGDDKVQAVGARLRELGPLQAFIWQGETRLGSSVKEHYRAVFAKSAIPISMVFDPAGRLTGFFFQ